MNPIRICHTEQVDGKTLFQGSLDPGEIVIVSNPHELQMIATLINESMNALSDDDFPARTVEMKTDAAVIRKSIRAIVQQLKKHGEDAVANKDSLRLARTVSGRSGLELKEVIHDYELALVVNAGQLSVVKFAIDASLDSLEDWEYETDRKSVV